MCGLYSQIGLVVKGSPWQGPSQTLNTRDHMSLPTNYNNILVFFILKIYLLQHIMAYSLKSLEFRTNLRNPFGNVRYLN